MKRIALCVLLASISSVVVAETYNMEADVSYTSTDYLGNDVDSSLFDLTYYFNPIDPGKGPLAEAAFLNKSSEISAKYGHTSQEYLTNATTWGVGGRYVHQNESSGLNGLIIGFNYTNNSWNNFGEEGYPLDNQANIFDTGYFEIGAYITNFSNLTISYSTNQNDEQTPGEVSSKQRSNTLSVRYNHLFLMDGDTSIKINAKYSDTSFDPVRYSDNTMSESNDDELSSFNISGDYYFNRQLSVGVGLNVFNNGYADNLKAYRLQSNYYFNENVSVYGSVGYSELDFPEEYADEDNQITTFEIGVTATF